jgi:hypothetical protein
MKSEAASRHGVPRLDKSRARMQSNKMTSKDAARIQSAQAKSSQSGTVAKDSFAARAQSAAAKSEAKSGEQAAKAGEQAAKK